MILILTLISIFAEHISIPNKELMHFSLLCQGGPRETNNSRKTNKKSDTGVEYTQISISWVAYIHK